MKDNGSQHRDYFKMALSTENRDQLMKEIEGLPPDKVKEVLDFIGYLKMKEFNSGVDIASLVLQQRSLARIWEGEEEDLYELQPRGIGGGE